MYNILSKNTFVTSMSFEKSFLKSTLFPLFLPVIIIVIEILQLCLRLWLYDWGRWVVWGHSYTQVRFSICVEMSEPLWEVSCQKGSLQITNRRGCRYMVYCVVVVLVGLVVAVDAVNDNSELNEAASEQWAKWFPPAASATRRDLQLLTPDILEMTASENDRPRAAS